MKHSCGTDDIWNSTISCSSMKYGKGNTVKKWSASGSCVIHSFPRIIETNKLFDLSQFSTNPVQREKKCCFCKTHLDHSCPSHSKEHTDRRDSVIKLWLTLTSWQSSLDTCFLWAVQNGSVQYSRSPAPPVQLWSLLPPWIHLQFHRDNTGV